MERLRGCPNICCCWFGNDCPYLDVGLGHRALCSAYLPWRLAGQCALCLEWRQCRYRRNVEPNAVGLTRLHGTFWGAALRDDRRRSRQPTFYGLIRVY